MELSTAELGVKTTIGMKDDVVGPPGRITPSLSTVIGSCSSANIAVETSSRGFVNPTLSIVSMLDEVNESVIGLLNDCTKDDFKSVGNGNVDNTVSVGAGSSSSSTGDTIELGPEGTAFKLSSRPAWTNVDIEIYPSPNPLISDSEPVGV